MISSIKTTIDDARLKDVRDIILKDLPMVEEVTEYQKSQDSDVFFAHLDEK